MLANWQLQSSSACWQHCPFARLSYTPKWQIIPERGCIILASKLRTYTQQKRIFFGLVLLSAPSALGIFISDVLLYGMLSSLGTFVHVVNDALVVLEQLRPFLFICRSDQVTIHIKGHWFEVYIFDEFKTFELLLFSYS